MTYKKWTLSFICILISIITLITSFNYIIDPYGIYQFNTSSYNARKIAFRDLYQFKTFHINKLQPETIILGTSRAMRIAPSYIEQLTGKSTYNMGIYSTTPYVQYKYLEYSLKVDNNLQAVFLGLDYETFNSNFPTNHSYNEQRLDTSIYVKDWFTTLLSDTSIKDSAKVLYDNITHNDKYTTSEFLIDGTVNEEYTSPFNTIEGTLYWANADYILSYSSIQYIQKMKELCEQHNVSLYLFIPPIHAILLESQWQKDNWENFEAWKKAIVNIAPIWDFSGFNDISMSSIKDKINFNDLGHFSKQVGNLIVHKMIAPETNLVPTYFGVYVTNDNITEHLSNLRANREYWIYRDQDMNALAFDY